MIIFTCLSPLIGPQSPHAELDPDIGNDSFSLSQAAVIHSRPQTNMLSVFIESRVTGKLIFNDKIFIVREERDCSVYHSGE